MKFLLDQGLPRSTIGHLQRRGLEAEHVGNIGLAKAADATILEAGRRRDAVIVTLDSDFHALLALANASSPSVIRIRIEGLKGEGVAKIIHQVFDVAGQELKQGAVVTITNRRLALRRLPLIPLDKADKPDSLGEDR